MVSTPVVQLPAGAEQVAAPAGPRCEQQAHRQQAQPGPSQPNRRSRHTCCHRRRDVDFQALGQGDESGQILGDELGQEGLRWLFI